MLKGFLFYPLAELFNWTVFHFSHVATNVWKLPLHSRTHAVKCFVCTKFSLQVIPPLKYKIYIDKTQTCFSTKHIIINYVNKLKLAWCSEVKSCKVCYVYNHIYLGYCHGGLVLQTTLTLTLKNFMPMRSPTMQCVVNGFWSFARSSFNSERNLFFTAPNLQ